MNQKQLLKLSVSDLSDLYDREFQELKISLLNGTTWNRVQLQRNKVRKIADTLHKRFNRNYNRNPDPSSFNTR